jgi:hypothetical protein
MKNQAKNCLFPKYTPLSTNVTIFKCPKWWEAIVVSEAYGKRSIGVYLWVKKNDVWKRKNKFSVRNLDEWNKVKDAVEQLAQKLASK